MKSQRPEQPDTNFIQRLDKNVLKIIFSSFSKHEQWCQLARVSFQFRKAALELAEQNYSGKIPKTNYELLPEHYISKFHFFHSSKKGSSKYDNFFTTDWSLAAFLGDEVALRKLLGDNFAEAVDESKRNVAHFAALGGQLPLLKRLQQFNGNPPAITAQSSPAPLLLGSSSEALRNLPQTRSDSTEEKPATEITNNSLITQKALLGFGCIHFAAMGQHIETLRWLINEQGLSLFDVIDLMGFDGLSYLHTKKLNDHVALILSPLLCDTLNDATKLIPQNAAELHSALQKIEQYPPEFNSGDNLWQGTTPQQLIVATMKHIICEKKREYLLFLNQLVAYDTHYQKNPVFEVPKFLL